MSRQHLSDFEIGYEYVSSAIRVWPNIAPNIYKCRPTSKSELDGIRKCEVIAFHHLLHSDVFHIFSYRHKLFLKPCCCFF